MREIIYVTVKSKKFIVDPVADALDDISRGKPHKCMTGTGIAGYQTYTLDGGSTAPLSDLPIRVSSGRAHCTQFPPDPAFTSNDYEYMLQYNQTILHHLDHTRQKTFIYSQVT